MKPIELTGKMKSSPLGTAEMRLSITDINTIHRIADRAKEYYSIIGLTDTIARIRRDILVCQRGDTPLNLEKLISMDDDNFVHDIMGIRRNLNRTNGKMYNNFLPRSAR